LIKERVGIGSEEAERRIGAPDDFIYVLQQQKPGTQQRIRQEISERTERVLGVPQSDVRASLEEAQWARAAHNRSGAPAPSFRKQLASLGMSEEELKYWLSLADEED
jgi:hypothetical protein